MAHPTWELMNSGDPDGMRTETHVFIASVVKSSQLVTITFPWLSSVRQFGRRTTPERAEVTRSTRKEQSA
jgi:hypothetical protein